MPQDVLATEESDVNIEEIDVVWFFDRFFFRLEDVTLLFIFLLQGNIALGRVIG